MLCLSRMRPGAVKAKPMGTEEAHQSAGPGGAGVAAARFCGGVQWKELRTLSDMEGSGRVLTEGGWQDPMKRKLDFCSQNRLIT